MDAESRSLITPSNTIKFLFCVCMVGLTFCQNLAATSLNSVLEPVYEKTIFPLGLWQGWTMFTSNQGEVLAVRNTYYFKDGQQKIVYSPFGQHPRYLPTIDGELAPNLYYYDTSNGFKEGYLTYLCKHPQIGVPSDLQSISFDVAKSTVPFLGNADPQDIFTQNLTYQWVFKVSC